jgi:hypothetical protein
MMLSAANDTKVELVVRVTEFFKLSAQQILTFNGPRLNNFVKKCLVRWTTQLAIGFRFAG